MDDPAAFFRLPIRGMMAITVRVDGVGMVMNSFHSATLNRTFGEVIFLGGVSVAGE